VEATKIMQIKWRKKIDPNTVSTVYAQVGAATARGHECGKNVK
jgi:hypothetical protein